MNKKEMLQEKIKLLKQLDLKKRNFKETFKEAEKTDGMTEDYLKKIIQRNHQRKNKMK